MTMPNFLFCTDSQLPGAGHILSTAPPYILAKVLKFSTRQDLQTFLSKHTSPTVSVPGYNILLNFYTTFTAYTPPYDDIRQVLQQMAEYYHTEKIITNLRYYKKYEN